MTAMAVNLMSKENRLSRITNGKLVVCKEPMNYTGEPFTSLPPLPSYTIEGAVRTRWGEDGEIDRLRLSSANIPLACRNNFDSCHPVSENPEHLKYEGYMFPKPMHQDLTVLRCSVLNTCRRVPRDAKCEMFPRHDPQRLRDGKPVLGEATRNAIEDNIANLYRKSRYNMQYLDTTRFMVDKAKRDAQYHMENPDKGATPTCSRVHNHPDPCPHCWYGGCNKDFETKTADFLSRQTITKLTTSDCQGNSETHSSQNNDVSSEHMNHCIVGINEQQIDCDCLKVTCGICCKKAASAHIRENSGNSQSADGELNEDGIGKAATRIEKYKCENEAFGPWQENSKQHEGAREELVLNDIYNFKLPSTVHCESTQNEYATDWENRHNYHLNNIELSFDQWKSLCRSNLQSATQKTAQNIQQQPSINALAQNISHKTQNSWTNREENNLRIPCIANILGSSHKSDAHKRFHLEHPEPIPDLRDNRKYARRVKFYGFSSSIFR